AAAQVELGDLERHDGVVGGGCRRRAGWNGDLGIGHGSYLEIKLEFSRTNPHSSGLCWPSSHTGLPSQERAGREALRKGGVLRTNTPGHDAELLPRSQASACRHHASKPFWACSRFSASSKTTDWGPSMTSSVTSSPRCAGRQCMKSASDLALAIRLALIWYR